MTHQLPTLGYDYRALEPYIDARTMEIHYSKHHKTYVDKLNAALENHPALQKKTAVELVVNLNSLPDSIQGAVRNHGGGHVNHSFFWTILKKDVAFKGEIAEAIKKEFGSFDEFKKQFSEKANTLFGSGWAWLVVNRSKKLEIIQTQNQETPLRNGFTPILGIDVWEHAYYLKYQNKRAEYVDAFFNVIDWKKVNEYYVKAKN
ncbi:superoxide dismutase [Candidatus Pacearchaeota archaeon CG10_big_fil_rev_8_21_14_0_10_32_14]|nr:MAG: superoxide dismutase [Candidatus Pacearchaeota archaeon CG10_big_fil_rev_8_21_14_0_10_32_14]